MSKRRSEDLDELYRQSIYNRPQSQTQKAWTVAKQAGSKERSDALEMEYKAGRKPTASKSLAFGDDDDEDMPGVPAFRNELREQEESREREQREYDHTVKLFRSLAGKIPIIYEHDKVRRTEQLRFKIASGSQGNVFLRLRDGKISISKVVNNDMDDYELLVDELAFLLSMKENCKNCVVCPYYLETNRELTELSLDTEYIVGSRTLSSYTEHNRGDLNNIDLAVIFLNAIECLDYIHSKEVVHRDIKPDNMLFVPETMTVKYLDFGLACGSPAWYSKYGDDSLVKLAKQALSTPLDRSLDCLRNVSGTPYYKSPQLFNYGEIDESIRLPVAVASDVWALGVSMYQFITGEYPFDGRDADDLEDDINDSVPPKLTERDLGEFFVPLEGMLNKEWEERMKTGVISLYLRALLKKAGVEDLEGYRMRRGAELVKRVINTPFL